MKVLFVISDGNAKGGTEILAFNLLHEFNRVGIECKLLSIWVYKGEDNDVISLPTAAAKSYCRIVNSPVDKLCGHVLSDRFLSKEIEKIAMDGGYEWIINHTYDLCAAIPQIKGVRTVQVFNWSILGYEKVLSSNILSKGKVKAVISYIGFMWLRFRWHKVIACFNKLILLTDNARSEIKAIVPDIMDEQLVTIPDPLIVTKAAERFSSLQNKVVVFVGRLSHEKGVMRLLRIWKKVQEQLPDFRLHIYGTGGCLEEMQTFIEQNDGLKVIFMGFSKNLEEIYTNADLLLMTSDSEGFGMVLIEAMYYGVPCISFDCPVSPKEIIADAGVTVPCFDEGKYADEVVNILKDENRMRTLQRNSVKRAETYYIGKVVSLWQEMINR